MWLNINPPTASGAYGDRWDGYMIEISKPDGTKDSFGPFTSDPVGSSYLSYTPAQTGDYTIRFTFPGDTITGEPIPVTPTGQEFIGDYVEPSSDETTLTVQQDPIEPFSRSYSSRSK
jgi:hypothetical protein